MAVSNEERTGLPPHAVSGFAGPNQDVLQELKLNNRTFYILIVTAPQLSCVVCFIKQDVTIAVTNCTHSFINIK